MRIIMKTICLAFLSVSLWSGEPPADGADYESNWHQWRGPDATGVAPHSNPPVNWSEEQNVRWKIEIPGKGHATPIIWGEKIFVLTAVPQEGGSEPPPPQDGQRRRRGIAPSSILNFEVMALNRVDGSVIWQKTLREEFPHEGTHRDGTWASNSPITDGEHLYAYFGSRGLYCLDLDGNLKWEKDFGEMRTRRGFGEGSSPAIYENTMIINWDHEEADFVVALDKRTGEELWRKDRDEPTSWSTPLIVNVNGTPQVIINATNYVRSYDIKTGDIIWESTGMTLNAIPSPVIEDGVVFLMSGFRGNALQAIRLEGAKGDVTGTEAILWDYDRDTPYVPSPLLYNGGLYFLKSNDGILTCFNTKTGERNYGPQRLDGISNVYASPVGAAGRVYFTGRQGGFLVIEAGNEFKILAENKLDDMFDASPAIAGNEIYLRGHKYLYCIAEGK